MFEGLSTRGMAMKILRSILVMTLLIIGFGNSAAANELKILIVVTQNVESLYDGDNVAASIESTVGDAFGDAGLAQPNIVVSHIRPQLAEPAISGSALMALAHVPPISTQRAAQAADLVLIVGLRTNDTPGYCGAAPGISTNTPNYLSDILNGRFALNRIAKHMAYVTMLHPNCTFIPSDVQAAHEIGHLLFAEHEVIYDTNGNAVSEVTSNSDPDKPFKENHPKEDYPDRTIMFSGGPRLTSVFYSDSGKEFLPGVPASGPYEDVAKVFGDTTYDYVARYKEPPTI